MARTKMTNRGNSNFKKPLGNGITITNRRRGALKPLTRVPVQKKKIIAPRKLNNYLGRKTKRKVTKYKSIFDSNQSDNEDSDKDEGDSFKDNSNKKHKNTSSGGKTSSQKQVTGAKSVPSAKRSSKSTSVTKKTTKVALKRKVLKEEDDVDDNDDISESDEEKKVSKSSRKLNKKTIPAKGASNPKRNSRNHTHSPAKLSAKKKYIPQSDKKSIVKGNGTNEKKKQNKVEGSSESEESDVEINKTKTKAKNSKLLSKLSSNKLPADIYFNSKNSNLNIDCCVHCNNRNVLRAIETSDQVLLKKCIDSTNEISSLNDEWSVESSLNVFEIAVRNGDKKMLVELINYFTDKKNTKKTRVVKPSSKLKLIGSGNVSFKTFGRRVRKVNMTRGGKLGNNAFLDDIIKIKKKDHWRRTLLASLQNHPDNCSKFMTYVKAIKIPEKYLNFHEIKFRPENKFNLETCIHSAVNRGNRVLAYNMINLVRHMGNLGLNELHKEVLTAGANDNIEVKFKPSVNKKSRLAVTPVHFACINPNEKILKTLIEKGGDINNNDMFNKKPIHYAATCEGEGPLKVLISKGANVNEREKNRFTPLLYAAKFGRLENVKLLVKHGAEVNHKPLPGANMAIHWACLQGHLDIVKYLLSLDSVDIEATGADKMTPLHCACKAGHENIVEYLLQKGANPCSKDKLNRTPLLISVKAGFPRIVTLLLNYDSDYEISDNSGNSPLHYACAYGWMENVKILLKMGANINAVNIWKTTPLEVAILKNHFGIVKYLLNNSLVDVNTKFENGNTLLLHSLLNLTPKTIDEITFLIQDKKCAVDVTNFNKNTALHLLAKLNFENSIKNFVPSFGKGEKYQRKREKFIRENRVKLENEYRDIIRTLIKLLVESGIDINAKDIKGQTALCKALQSKSEEYNPNYIFITELLVYKPDLLFITKEGDTILHYLSKSILCKEGIEIWNIVIKELNQADYREKISEMNFMNIINNQGLSALLKLSHYYYTSVFTLYNEILKKDTLDRMNTLKKISDKEEVKTKNKKFRKNQKNVLPKEDQEKIRNEASRKFVSFLNDNLLNIILKLIELGADAKLTVKRMENNLMKINVSGHKNFNLHNNYKRVKFARRIKNDKKKLNKVQKISQNYYQGYGNTNCLMFFMSFPLVDVIKYLVEKANIDVNDTDVLNQNCIFYLMNTYEAVKKISPELLKTIMDYLIIENKLNINNPDICGNTLFFISVTKWYTEMLLTFSKAGSDINFQNEYKENPLLYLIKYNKVREIEWLMENCGDSIDINITDKFGRTALHYAMFNDDVKKDLNFSVISLLLSKKIDPNIKDYLGRTAIFYLFIKNREYETDAIDPIASLSFILELKNLNLNIQDVYGNTVLFYAIQRSSYFCFSTLISKGAKINISNNEGNTPLSYSILLGTNNSSELISYGANLDSRIYPLDIRNVQFKDEKEEKNKIVGGMLVEDSGIDSDDSSSINDDEENEDNSEAEESEVENEEEDESEEESENDEDDESNNEENEEENAKDSEHKEDDESDVENGEIDLQDKIELTNESNKLLNIKPKKEYESRGYGNNRVNKTYFNNSNLIFNDYKKHLQGKEGDCSYQDDSEDKEEDSENEDEEKEEEEKDQDEDEEEMKENSEKEDDEYREVQRKRKEGVTLFRACVTIGQQGLIYYFLNNGYDFHLALNEVFVEEKSSLAMLLLNKSSDKTVYQKMNEKKQNLFHMFAIHSSNISKEDTKRLFDNLLSKGIPLDTFDKNGWQPIHYACRSLSLTLVKLILSKIPPEIMLNSLTQIEGYSPLILTFMGKNLELNNKAVYKLLRFIIYTMNRKKQPIDSQLSSMIKVETRGKDYLTTPLNLVCQHYARNFLLQKVGKSKIDDDEEDNSSEKMEEKKSINDKSDDEFENQIEFELMKLLVENGSNLREKDSDGIDCLMYTAIENSPELLFEVMLNEKCFKNQVSYESTNNEGKSLIHFIVQPLNEGSYQNSDFLKNAINAGFKFDIVDKYGRKPIDYAYLHQCKKLYNVLKNFDKISPEIEKLETLEEKKDVEMTILPSFNFEEDAEQYFKLRLTELNKKETLEILVDPLSELSTKTHIVFKDSKDRTLDVTLTKVDVGRTNYGEFLFYKMQVIYDTARDIYILWNRWGRIGEQGAFQRTPFTKPEEAISEFSKIFKAKTGNTWDNIENFEKKAKKYMLMQFNPNRKNQRDFLKKFKHSELTPKSELPQKTKKFIEMITKKAILYKIFSANNINKNYFSFSMLNQENISKAKLYLDEIKEAITKLGELKIELEKIQKSVKQIEDEKSKLNQIHEEQLQCYTNIYEFSNRYYELIPREEFRYSAAEPLNNVYKLYREYQLIYSLTYVEFAIKILLGALYRQKEVNPLDYCYRSLNTKIWSIEKNTTEWNYLMKYINNTKEDLNFKVENIFGIDRREEDMSKHKNLENHYLLFHGTKTFNFLGILSQGLKIAPVETPNTGTNYGKGVYFADKISKSYQYCDYDYNNLRKRYILLCEVALGKVLEVGWELEFKNEKQVTNSGYNSLKALSTNGPDSSKMFVMNTGVIIPLGENTHYEYDEKKLPKKKIGSSLRNDAEYVVYNEDQVKIRYLIEIQN